jgi:hypothetical protein
VARTLVSAASRFVSTLFSTPCFGPRRQCGNGNAMPSRLFGPLRKSVETNLDAADTSVRATSWLTH